MAITITSNADLPTCLNTESKQVKKAKQLAHSHSGIPAKKARGPRIQGFFSRTMIVTLQSDEEVIIQFRPEPMDMEPFKIAREALGPVVPDIELLKDEDLERDGIWAYWMTPIPGQTWFEGTRGKGPKVAVTINKSLGKIFSKGYVKGSSDSVVDSKLRPHLELLLSSSDDQIHPFKEVARDLLSKLDQLKKLPLFISHFDLNEMNIMVDENCEVSGIIDWEFSSPLPFGMGFGRIHTLAGEFSEKKFHMPGDFEESERGFWQEVFDGVPADIREVLDANLDMVQTAVILGTMLDTFELEEGKLGPYNPVSVEALPKFLSYRIPFLRNSDPPYSN
ncbi:hypothetical protein HOY80DRAFT_993763 [Tuber brumale]|nr:hypothetical protein HOY80DRAFT_993763 [Tuber brumale]